MFEGVVAGALNRWLGKYLADLDTEQLNVGIFSGRVCLTDLKLKPEALYELGLPVDVKIGSVGKIELQIPWATLSAQPVAVSVEDVLVLVGPAVSAARHDAERERRLQRAAKLAALDALDARADDAPQRLLESLLAALLSNVQVSVRNVHVRYEDSLSSKDGPFACGMCLQSVSVETTNSKWKPCAAGGEGGAGAGAGAGSVYQMMRLEAWSLYWNARATVLDDQETAHITPIQYYNWKHYMLTGLHKFSMHREQFDFLVKPVSCKVKVIVNRCAGGAGAADARAPLLLLDVVLQDSAVQLSRAQYLSLHNLLRSFRRIALCRKYRALHPGAPVLSASGTRAWWRYACEAVVRQRVRPYSWAGVRRHRASYARYKAAYKAALRSPADAELRLDLHKCEDDLDILSVVVAREHANIELLAEEPERVEVRGRLLRARGERSRKSLWSQLSSPEKRRVCELIGRADSAAGAAAAAPGAAAAAPGAAAAACKPKQYIEHKVNVTLGNWSLTLSSGGREVLVLTLAHFLASLETRPGAGAYKVSARAESVAVEGASASAESELVPLLTADPAPAPPAPAPSAPAPAAPNMLALDWEKKPLGGEADYGLVAALEPIEIVYHEHAVSEIIRFFRARPVRREEVVAEAGRLAARACAAARAVLRLAVSRRKLFSLQLDLKGICLVLPEHGSMHKAGSVLVAELGRAAVRTELQPSQPALEDATCMELEERLYDRLHADCSGLQVLFCDGGERWRELRKLPDSELHLLARLRLQLVFSNSIQKDYALLPRHKLNVSMSSLKLNASDRSIGQLVEFAEHLPLPLSADAASSTRAAACDSADYAERARPLARELRRRLELDRVRPEPSFRRLLQLRADIVAAHFSRNRSRDEEASARARLGFAQTEPACAAVFVSAEHSDEDMEVYARSVDLPGFDDNVSPHNAIRVLLRFVIGEVVVNVSRSTPLAERPYVLLAAGKLCLDTALLEYGPAVQLSVRSLLLSDKRQRAAAGEYLDLLSTGDEETLNLLYRKVRADCPDFKSHFHSVEQSLVADVGALRIALHADALRTLYNYTQYVHHKLQSPRVLRLSGAAARGARALWRRLMGAAEDPPVPPGATKFSYSVRASQVVARLHHLDCELLEARLSALESDCVFRANDRMILKLFLSALSVDDLSDVTLYPKLVWPDEDKVFEMKYVRHSPRVHARRPGSAAAALDPAGAGGGAGGETDGSLRIYLGRMHVVLLYKLLVDLQQFLEPLVPSGAVAAALAAAESGVQRHATGLRAGDARLTLAVDVRAPTLLLPQNCASPNLLVFNCGDLLVENFFKEVGVGAGGADAQPPPLVDNVLLKLANVTLARAVMTLAGSLEVQEPILEPVSVRVDVKRAVGRRGAGARAAWEADAVMDAVLVNLGQRDLATLLAVWGDNCSDAQYLGSLGATCAGEEPGGGGDGSGQVDAGVVKLQEFFAKAEPVRKEASVRFSLDGVEMKLFSDVEEVLSSPVREAGRGLARLAAGELRAQLHVYSDRSLDLRASLHTLLLDDIRPDSALPAKRMFESHGGAGKVRVDSGICVSTPPIVDVTFRQNESGDRNLHLHVEKTRLYFSVPFFVHLGRFLLEATPGERGPEGGVVNHGYVGESRGGGGGGGGGRGARTRPPSSPDSTSGYYSTGAVERAAGGASDEAPPGLSVSAQFRQPEIVLSTEAAGSGGGDALLLRTELLFDYSHHATGENLTVSLAGLQVLWRRRSPFALRPQPPRTVLRPCDLELSRSYRAAEEGVRVALSLSAVELHVAAAAVRTLADVAEEWSSELSAAEEREAQARPRPEPEELWSPRKLAPHSSPQDVGEDAHGRPRVRRAPRAGPPETLTLSVPSVRLTLELEPTEGMTGASGVVSARATLQGTLHEWSRRPRGSATLTLCASVYNERLDAWEPLLEAVSMPDRTRTPWTIHCDIFQAEAYPMSSEGESGARPRSLRETQGTRGGGRERRARRRRADTSADTSPDEGQSDGEMCFIRAPHSAGAAESGRARAVPGAPPDEHAEDGTRADELAAAVTHLFAEESSGEELSEEAESSSGERSEVEPEPLDTAAAATAAAAAAAAASAAADDDADERKKEQKSVVLQEACAWSSDSGVEAEGGGERRCGAEERRATYAVVAAREPLELTATPHAARLLADLLDAFTRAPAPAHPLQRRARLELINDIGPGSTVHLVTRAEANLAGKERVLAVADFDADVDTSRASTPDPDPDPPGRDLDSAPALRLEDDWDCLEGEFVADTLTPPGTPLYSPTHGGEGEAVAALYRKVTDERLVLKLHDRDELTVLCPQRDVTKLHALRPSAAAPHARYYVLLERSTRAALRRIVLRSPLQVSNETSYTLELFYRKTELEALGLEAPGELANPFDDKLRLAVVEPHHTYNVPLYVAYHCPLFLLPSNFESYRTATQGLWWRELAAEPETPRDVVCPARLDTDRAIFAMRILTVPGCQAEAEKVTCAIPNYLIRVLPPLALHNRLPYAVHLHLSTLDRRVRLEAGERTHCYLLDLASPHTVSVEMSYAGAEWRGSFTLSAELEERCVRMRGEGDEGGEGDAGGGGGGERRLALRVRLHRADSWQLFLHAPYWIVNKTGLPLQMKASRSDVTHELGEEPLLYGGAGAAGRRAVRLRAHLSAWSRAFGLDAVGAPGLVVCAHRERRRKYRILLKTSLSELCPQLTRIVTLLPYFLVHNDTRRHLRFMEENEAADLWIDLAPAQCLPFWPETDSMRLHCKLRDSPALSQHFPLARPHFTVLRMDKGSALCVEVSGGADTAWSVRFRDYNAGDAPVRVHNLCDDLFLKLHQRDSPQVALLSPYHSTLYTWDDPCAERTLVWNIYNNKAEGFVADLSSDGFGEEKVSFHSIKHSTLTPNNSVTSKLSSTLKRLAPAPRSPEPAACSSSSEDSESERAPAPPPPSPAPAPRPDRTRRDKVIVYWVCYREREADQPAGQRVLVLTQDERVARRHRARLLAHRAACELYLSLASVGLSVCVSDGGGGGAVRELAYLSLSGSTPRWEANLSRRWKPLSAELTAWLEERYAADAGAGGKWQLRDYVHVDLERMQMTKPFFSELRRSWSPAVRLQLRRSASQTYLRLRLHRLQLDNQLPDAVFPCVLYPAPASAAPPAPRPCLRLLLHRDRARRLYKRVELAVQPYSVNLDRGFVHRVFDVLNRWRVEEKPAVRLRADLALVHAPLAALAPAPAEPAQCTLFERVRLSSLCCTLSLSAGGYCADTQPGPGRTRFGDDKKESKPKMFNSDLLEHLFDSWGASLGDVKDVHIGMRGLERSGWRASGARAAQLAQRHYATQLLQQFHVLVLGRDILGNRYAPAATPCDHREVAGDDDVACADGGGAHTDEEGDTHTHEVADRLERAVSALLGHCVRGGAGAGGALADCPLTALHAHARVPPAANVRYGSPGAGAGAGGAGGEDELPASVLETTRSFALGVALALGGLVARAGHLGPGCGAAPALDVYREAVTLAQRDGGGCHPMDRLDAALRSAVERSGGRLVARRRLPRHCDAYEGVRPYCVHEALGERLLLRLGRGHYADTDAYLAHVTLPPPPQDCRHTVLLTTRRLFMVRAGGGGGGCGDGAWRVEWLVNLDDLLGVPVLRDNKLLLNVKQNELVSYLSSEERAVQCAEPSVLRWLQARVESALVLRMEDKRCQPLL